MDDELVQELIPRRYQNQLEEIATKKNTIIHLPTGSGKTFIAIALIKKFRGDLKKPWGQGGKRTFFLVNTIPLVNQQKKVILSLCPVVGVGGYSGEDGVDYWNKSKWDSELENNQVVVMTCQILADMLTHSYVRIEDINLLIFDECHHAVDDHPMRLVMKHFECCPPQKQPRVLGLTATLLNSNVSVYKVEETLRELETTFHATIATVDDLGEVLCYSTNPMEVLKFYEPHTITDAEIEAIDVLKELQALIMSVQLPHVAGHPNVKLERWQKDITSDPKKIVKEVKNMVGSMIMFIEELGTYGGVVGILAYVILMERLKRKAVSVEEENLYKFSITHSALARMILVNAMKSSKGYEKIWKHSSDKVLQLLGVLKEYNHDTMNKPGALMRVNISKKPISAIIFTKQRFTAKVLYNILKDVKEANPKEFGFLKHDFIVGFNINPYSNTREQFYTQKASQVALLKFKNQDLNCLISTSVIEEGVDISQCRLVLRYDEPMEYRSYIQSKGRARSSDSSYVIMISKIKKEKFMKSYDGFQRIEKYIQRMLVGSTDDRDAPSNSHIQTSLYEDEEIAPYVTEHGARLSSVQAISLLNRYCSLLPHDFFTVITPMWIEESLVDPRKGVQKLVKLYMPISCPVKDVIVGTPHNQLKEAKRSAALNACIKLHQEGELDAITLLPRRYGLVDFEQPDVRQCFPNWPWDKEDNEQSNNDDDEDDDDRTKNTKKPGTKKCVRKYKKVFPYCLERPKTWSSGTNKFYLHVLKLKTVFKAPKESGDKALYDLLQMKEGFGFLTSKALPKICDFPMFLSLGEVATSVHMNNAVTELDAKLFEIVKYFHFFIFDQVLDIAKRFVVFDGKQNSMYVVPVKENGKEFDIDWEAMLTHKQIRPIEQPSYVDRRNMKVNPEDYKYSVVSPWYRGTISPPRYIVADVIEYKTPHSSFGSPSEPSSTYADYYSTKYNLEILGDKNQPLLDVCSISTKGNCLMPRSATISSSLTEKQKKLIAQAHGDDKRKGFPEMFVPEFCIKYDFPGVLWYKALMLPSIIHRITMLLVAHELREEIAIGTRYGQPRLLFSQNWLPIEVDIQSAIKTWLSQIEDRIPITSVDRINNPIDDEAPRPDNVMSMKESIYKLQQQKIAEEYPWDAKLEPIDIERNIATVTLMDIECYDEFVSAALSVKSPTPVKSPPHGQLASYSAIMPPPVSRDVKINLLEKKLDNFGPQLREVLTAITTINSQDSMNLERVETLGDSFLKFAASLFLFHKFPKLNEGQLTNIKGRLIGNRNLYYAGEKIGLGGRMKAEHFSPRQDYSVPGFFAPKEIQDFIEAKKLRPSYLNCLQFSLAEQLSGQLEGDSVAVVRRQHSTDDWECEREPPTGVQPSMQAYVRAQAVSDKSIADCVEALIGTYLISGGIQAAVKLVEWLKVLPSQDNFAQYLNKTLPTVLSEKKTTVEDVHRILNDSREDVEAILNYKFKDPAFLLEALSHPSYIRNRLTRSYERFEFLGDAILDFLITSHIFEQCSDLGPGDLTDLRSALVNNVTFASYVVKLGLQKHICYQLNPALETAIITFIEHQERRNHCIVEDVLYLIDEEECHIAEYVEVPKVLSDIFESLVGAIFLDSGGDLQKVWSVVYRIMAKEIHDFSRRIPQQPVRVLYENIHACPIIGKAYLDETKSLSVMVPVTITKNGQQHTVNGFGKNKFQAKRAAAKFALRILSL